ncbi:extracellular solute-binding protein [Cereibacter sphaeroides]|uniref:ABC transporter substrate-binding protein n=1 Tax=Cereibacter sphaeroides TaxID=1063 RepID=UPI001F34CFEE|nr:extracellular solute-binding protein [Cereibacter sphaeroides]MCE6957699.1 extracellular solute-binding protein [Cereibacter sphaeroides]MCE6967275.1 extracellular solute-binding protein [Cereibacter sphaeroides]MCE6971464.1 extracellular solute-binding protein [Cereibacter sphaeroides]
MTKTTLRAALLATSGLMLTAGIAAAQDYGRFGIKEDVPGACSYASIDAKDYSGRTLNIITHAIPVIGEPTALHAQQFQELTGATVNVVHVPFGDLFQRIMIPFQTGQAAYDVLFYASLWLGDFHNYLAEVPAEYQQTSGMEAVTATYKGVAGWAGKMLNYTMDGDRHYLKYRADVFENPAMQALFKEKTGRDLTVPATWEEYNEVAAVFNNTDWDGDGAPNFGTAEVTKRDDLMFSAFISRVAPYAKHPGVKGGFFFDLESMEPLVNTPGWVRGLELFVDAQKSMPPGGTSFGLGDEIFSFGGGQTLMSYSWDDAFIQAMQSDSPIRNKVAAAPLPGAREVWNRTTGQWDKFDTPNTAPYVTWGWSSAVASGSQNQDMAFDFLCFFSNEANTLSDLQVGRFGVNPYREAHFDPAFYQSQLGWDAKVAQSYTDTLRAVDGGKNQVFDLRVPGVGEFMSSLAAGVARAQSGEATAQEALDGVAAEWKAIVDRIGADRVREAYANVVALEDR